MRLLIIIIILLTKTLLSQNDTINKYNSVGKKQGYWKQFLDLNLNRVDSLNSNFYGYDLYDNGVRVIGYFNTKSKKRDSLVHTGVIPAKGQPIIINGEFKWYNKKTNAIDIIEIFYNGRPISFESYTNEKNDTIAHLKEYCDFTKKYNNEFGTSYYKFIYGSDNKTEEYWYRKVNNRWNYYKIKK